MSAPFLLDSFAGTAGAHLRTSVDGRHGTDAAGTSNGLAWDHVTDFAIGGDQAGGNPGFGIGTAGTRASDVFSNPEGLTTAFTFPGGGTGVPATAEYDICGNFYFPAAAQQNIGVLLRWDTSAAAGSGNGYYSRIINGVVSLARLTANSGVAVASGQALPSTLANGENRILRYSVRTHPTSGNPVLTVMIDGIIPTGMNAVEDTGASAVHKLKGVPGLRLVCNTLGEGTSPGCDGVVAMDAGSTALTSDTPTTAPGTSAVAVTMTGTGTGWKALGAVADPNGTIYTGTGRRGYFRISGTTQSGSGSQVASLSSCTVASDTSATLQLVPGTNTGTVTLLDITSGQTTTLAVASGGSASVAGTLPVPAPTMTGALTATPPAGHLAGSIAIPAPMIAGALTVIAPAGPSGSLAVPAPTIAGALTVTAPAGPVTIPVSDANWTFSPYGWVVANGAAVAVCGGQYFKVGFTGTSARLLLDATSLNPPTGQGTQPATTATPTLRYSIDRGPATDYALPNNATGTTTLTLATGLTAGTHMLRAWIRSVDRAVDEWSPVYTSVTPAVPTGCVRITGLQVDAGSASAPYTYWDGSSGLRPKRALFYGDSFAAGMNTLAVSNAQSGQDATVTFCRWIAEGLDAEYGVFGWSHQGWVTGGFSGSNVPPLLYDASDANASWNKVFSGAYIPGLTSTGGSFTVQPDYIVIMQGGNDGGQPVGTATTQGSVNYSVRQLLTKLRAAAPGAYIFVLNLPGEGLLALSGGTLSATLSAAVSSYRAAANDARVAWLDASPGIDEGGFGLSVGEQSLDGQHPTPMGHAAWGARYTGLIRAQLAGGVSSPIGCGFIRGA